MVGAGLSLRAICAAPGSAVQCAVAVVVVKIGGASLDTPALREQFCRDVAGCAARGEAVVVVHGGGQQISQLMAKLGVAPTFHNGQRITDQAALEVASMVLCGQIGPSLVRGIAAAGGRAVGLHGGDGGLCVGTVTTGALGLVPDELMFSTGIVEQLAASYVPVISSIAMARDGTALNVNADVFAAELAVALRAGRLLLLTDTPGVRGADGRVLASLTEREAAGHIASGVISGGMIPKVEFALAALARGVGQVDIVDGRQVGALSAALAGNRAGTTLCH